MRYWLEYFKCPRLYGLVLQLDPGEYLENWKAQAISAKIFIGGESYLLMRNTSGESFLWLRIRSLSLNLFRRIRSTPIRPITLSSGPVVGRPASARAKAGKLEDRGSNPRSVQTFFFSYFFITCLVIDLPTQPLAASGF